VSFTSPRLRLVLILAVTLSILPVIAIISWFFTVQYKEAALIHLHHYAVTVAENVASAEADFIITENYASLQDSIISFQRRVHVESITVTTPEGIIIADTDPENLGDSLTVPIGGRKPAVGPGYYSGGFQGRAGENAASHPGWKRDHRLV